MDFAGQKLSEQLYEVVIVAFAAVGFVAGFATGSYRLLMALFGMGVIFALVVAVPSWPYFSQNELPWLPAMAKEQGGKDAAPPRKKR